ncbi:MAG: hypothetical protein KBC84_10695 [Proteobacteria bacterium]|nr:hypothetical protein [Pseudomonadota bacterium]
MNSESFFYQLQRIKLQKPKCWQDAEDLFAAYVLDQYSMPLSQYYYSAQNWREEAKRVFVGNTCRSWNSLLKRYHRELKYWPEEFWRNVIELAETELTTDW